MIAESAGRAIEKTIGEESPRIIAALIRIVGSFDLAADALQDAVAAAMTHWRSAGVPRNPGAWLLAVAQRKLIDFGRRVRTQRKYDAALTYELTRTAGPRVGDVDAEPEYPDDRLRLIFTCCHPALSVEARVALTLHTLGRLTTIEIARAFLVPEATLAQRLVRAKKKIAEARIPYEVPPADRLAERLDAVLAVIYLVFNEGYAASTGDALVRTDLAADAIRLGRTLSELMPSQPEVGGLLALMLLHDARRFARVDEHGALVPLEDQDRARWDRVQIAQGLEEIDAAVRCKRPGPYQLQAAIAATHARAETAAATDWTKSRRCTDNWCASRRRPSSR